VLGLLVALERAQTSLLERICSGAFANAAGVQRRAPSG
jgi:hypothetical protein